MKTTNCLIILLSALCLAGCKFDGSLRYEIWRLDASQATKVSFDMPWSTLDETVPLIEWVKVVPNEAVYIKLKNHSPRKYSYCNYDIPYVFDSWEGYDTETREYISGISFGITWSTQDIRTIMNVTGYNDEDTIKYNYLRNKKDDTYDARRQLQELLELSELDARINKTAMKMLPMLNNLLPRYPYASNVDGYFAAAYQTMLIHISTDSKYNGWYMFPIKEKKTYWNPQFPPAKKSYLINRQTIDIHKNERNMLYMFPS